ncbi:hypothetical protein D5039_21960 [Verminephrobacter aporrectodeae subsp. tuberculatae]|uniref:Uncharacterized protein n=1 Tax=Verminephrobacter aporrectodeae subsp. tuberculatae TaxID=1110392 RepID=A0ABT3KZE0_9BURK|nr:hypothetical protein [Verminephrobacter aporrectodeae]MCW5323708.1 hypothetical protein [Verminephrobacter aporrectodeae subsp. tuberculatae]MCW8208996.1 hypothetical protein [Verminephrobacter aporrectodeae subsp. tuberculatae]
MSIAPIKVRVWADNYKIADGGPFDADGQANGGITAPGAAARMPLSLMGQTPDAAGSLWF